MLPRPPIRLVATSLATAVVALVATGCGGASDEIGGSDATASSGAEQT